MSKQSTEYHYFDTPDGEDTVKKLWVATKTSGLVSLGVATADVLLLSHPKGYLQTLGRYAYICLPLMGITATFVLVKNMSTSIRDKDDKANWVLGALAAGGVFGTWRKSVLAGFTACSVLTVAAMVKKHALQNGWTLLDRDIQLQPGTVNSVRYDFTLIKNRPGNWTTGNSEK